MMSYISTLRKPLLTFNIINLVLLCVLLQRPERPGPGWDMGIRKWDASFYRDACPQELWRIQEKFYEMKNTSEDCLHLNIFSPNVS